jgi:hypothetical protein
MRAGETPRAALGGCWPSTMTWHNHASNSQHINGYGNGNGNSNANGNTSFCANRHAHGSSQASSSSVTNGMTAAAELARSATGNTTTPSVAASSPFASQQSADSNGGRPVFKNPLGIWRSPTPPAKRQKMTPGRGSSSFSSTSVAAKTPSGGHRRTNSGIVGQVPSSQPLPSQQTWTPCSFSHSQPAPSASSTTSRGPGARTPTPVRTPARAGSAAALPKLRRVSGPARPSRPVKVTETKENNRVVLVIDSSDDEDDDNSRSGPTPVPVPVVSADPATPATPVIPTIPATTWASVPPKQVRVL